MSLEHYPLKRQGTFARGLQHTPIKIPPLAAEMKLALHPPILQLPLFPVPMFPKKAPPGKAAPMPPKMAKKVPPALPPPKMQPKNLFGNGPKDNAYREYINKMRENSGRQEISNDVQGEGLREIYRGIKRTFGKLANSILPLRTNYPPKVREVLAKYGNEKIVKAFVCRKPLQEVIDFVVRLTSKIDLDDIFHLSMHVILESGTTLLVEKNDTIRIVVANDMNKRECRRIDGLNGKTLNDVLEATNKRMGKRFFVYRALNDNVGGNCQDFLKNILEANNARYEGQDGEYSFILQNVYDKVSGATGTAANFITDLSSRLNRLIYGNGLDGGAIFQCPPNYEFALAQFTAESWPLLEAEEWMHDNDLHYNRIDDTDTGIYNFVKIEPEHITNFVQHVVQTTGGRRVFIICNVRRTAMAAYGITATDVTGWLGKIGGVISDIFVPGSSIALEAAMDNLGSSIDRYIAEKKSAEATKAYIKILKGIRENPAYTAWQKSQILDIMNSIYVEKNKGKKASTEKISSLTAKLEKLKQGDYHETADYKTFLDLISKTGFDATSKGMLIGWVDKAKSPLSDLDDAGRQRLWDIVKAELLKSDKARAEGKTPQLGIAPPKGAGRRKGADMSKVGASRRYYDIVRKIGETTNIREKNKLEEDAVELAKTAGLEHIKRVHESAPTGKKIGTLSEVMRGEADRAKIPPLGKDEITPGIIAEYKNSVNSKISNLRGAVEGLGATGGRIPGSQVHSVVFPKDDWTQAQAIRWLSKHGYAHPKVDEEANTMRFRQIDPSKFVRFATKPITTEEGKTINLVIGFHTRRRAQAKKQVSATNIGE